MEEGAVSGRGVTVSRTITGFERLVRNRLTETGGVGTRGSFISCRGLSAVIVNVYNNSKVNPMVAGRDREILHFLLGSRITDNGIRFGRVSNLAVRGHTGYLGTVPSSILRRLGSYRIVLGNPAAAPHRNSN